MSEVIEEYIRAHPAQSEGEAFEGFAAQERIRAWLGSDPGRRERLRREFARVWSQFEAKPAPGGAAMVPPRAVPIHAPAMPAPAPPPTSAHAPASRPAHEHAPLPPPGPGARHLKVLCASCERMQVWADGSVIRCRHCGHVYDDMLELVPVRHVGMFHFLFGEGVTGVLVAGGIALLLLLLYLGATRL